MLKNKRILVAPLDWGLGHATRCIPIIRELISQGAEVILGADNLPLKLLRMEFPDLEYIEFPGLQIQYPSKNSMMINMAFQANKFLQSISEEKEFLHSVIPNYAIDAVISDNRYGVYSKNIPSIFITHQLFIKLPIGGLLLKKIVNNYISNFDECWIPDFKEKNNLSGTLSHKKNLPENYTFIGPLSRFKEAQDNILLKRKLMIILSGPEPTRSTFENRLLKQLENVQYKVLLVRGIPEELDPKRHNKNVQVIPMLTSKEMNTEIIHSETILCRAGYSSIMDLAKVGKKAILIPTHGQTEQEYLAEKLLYEKKCYSCAEKNLDIDFALKENEKFSGLKLREDKNQLSRNIKRLLNHSK